MNDSTDLPSGEWIDVLTTDRLPVDDVVAVAVAGHDIALYAVGEAIYATDNLCTHGDGRLCDGFLEGHEIECPLHQGRFDIRDGKGLCDPIVEPVRCYPVRISGVRVQVRFD
jgi:naphthalene 1,2-dioxygenase system ferredoxin subunit